MSSDSSQSRSELPAHWSRMARIWSLIGPPLRPSPEDMENTWKSISEWLPQGARPKVVILGVTPELYHLPWPEGSDIIAVDRAQGMIDAVWPGPPEDAVCGDWISDRIEPSSRNIALCDGGFNMLSHPQAQSLFIRWLHRIVAPGGLVVTRLFAPPPEQEEPEAVLDDLVSGRIPSLNALKLRIWTALQNNPTDGICVNDVWEAVRTAAPDTAGLMARIGWAPEHLEVLEVYRGGRTRFSFPATEEVIRMFCGEPGGFELESIRTGTYHLGERCPTLTLRRME